MYSRVEVDGLVETSLGKIKGASQRSKFGKPYFSFKGIPYAQPPLGNLRFAKPVPITPWNGILDLSRNKESPACWQVNPLLPECKYLMKGQEDCLYLNVFTNKLPDAENVLSTPVIFWIHGGAFTVECNDSKMYGPDLLLQHDVVLVTINYRLGPLGFLALGAQAGNQGMHDQVTALKWVQQHISAFGGDPKNVTIMGESAGGMSCMLHLVSPVSQGLFHKVIAMSGAGSTPFLHNDRKPQHYARALAKKLIAQSEDYSDEELLNKLRGVPAKQISLLASMFKDWDTSGPVCFKPCLDPQDGDEAFMPIPFVQAVQEGKVNPKIPIFTGCTSEEGLILSVPFHKYSNRWEPFFKAWTKWAPHSFFTRETELLSPEDQEKSLKIRNKFFPNATNDNPVPAKTEESLQAMEQCFSTSIWHAPMIHDAKILAEKGSQVFVYDFAYRGTMTLADVFRLSLIKIGLNFTARFFNFKWFQKDLGVCHGDDMFYYFTCKPFGMPSGLKTQDDKKVSQAFLNFITAFATHGYPGSQNQVEWKALNSNEIQTMKIDKNLSFGPAQADQLDRVEFWLNEIKPNPLGAAWNDSPIETVHDKIATKRC